MKHKKHNLIIAGSSGLIGGHALQSAIDSNQFAVITSLARKTTHQIQNIKHIISPTLDIEELDTSFDCGLIALGTTKKQAGGNQALYKIDHDLVVHVAKQMKARGVKRLAVVSSLGASPTSASHYLRCKGEMEQHIQALGFTALLFVRPGPLVGRKTNQRADEIWVQRMLSPLSPLLIGPLRNIKPILASDVACAMIDYLGKQDTLGTIHYYRHNMVQNP
ncbi:NAD(P)H-binding protein [Vibrio gallicus]|uniref:NAD(P)H-binding protein n=1 Tax=Vibrio gallicus TaxID=190897 RepID=UPI0021C4BA6D|nr:NAD(P)H-binding protein [Vibrio gallicus]